MLLRKSKIVTTSVNGLTINVLEKAITTNTNKNPYTARHSNMLRIVADVHATENFHED